MFSCASCGVQHTEGPVCSLCRCHYDFQCSGVTEAGFRRLGDRKNTWRCPKCKTISSPSPSPQSTQLDQMQEQLRKITLQLAPLASVVEDMKLIKSELSTVKESLNMAHDLINGFSDKVRHLETKITNLEKVAQEVPALRIEISKLENEFHDRDQWARAGNVEIREIPQKKNEDLYDIVKKIGDKCEFSIKKEDINYIARIPTRVTGAEKPIVVSFNNRYLKEDFVAASRKRKPRSLSELGFTVTGNYYVNDHLTQHNKNLLSKTKAQAKEKNFKFVWVKHCKIMARKAETSNILYIKCEKDLLKIA